MSATLVQPQQVSAVEEGGFSTRSEIDHELANTSAEAAARYEMEGAIVMARKFPRNEDKAFASLIKACGRPTFAENCCYSFPRGGEPVEGPSVYLAREAARCWGNIQYGCDIIRDDNDNRQICGWAWDLETNTQVAAEDSFAKLVYRKKGGWIKPDERDLRELTNRRAAILVRNSILSVIPSDLIEEAIAEAKKTLEKGAAANPDAARKLVIKAFASIGIAVGDLEIYLKHDLSKCSPAEIAQLRTVWKSISDGNSKWSDYVETVAPVTNGTGNTASGTAGSGPVSAADLTKKAEPANSPESRFDDATRQVAPAAPSQESALPLPSSLPKAPAAANPNEEPLSDLALEIEAALNDAKITRAQNLQIKMNIIEHLTAKPPRLSVGNAGHLQHIVDRNNNTRFAAQQ